MAKKFIQNNNDLAVAYYRYSSHAQSDASIEQQREAAKNYADGHGLQIVKEYEDAAISGTTDQRPGFQLMLSEIGKIRPAALIIWKTDRLGRDRFDLAIAKKQIRDAGCIIHYIAEPISGDAPETALMEGVLESMAEYYSRQLRISSAGIFTTRRIAFITATRPSAIRLSLRRNLARAGSGMSLTRKRPPLCKRFSRTMPPAGQRWILPEN